MTTFAMEKKGNMTTRKEIEKMLPEKVKEMTSAQITDAVIYDGAVDPNGRASSHNAAISDTANLLTDRVATMEEINEIVWDTIQCALDKGNYRAGGREELEQIFLDIEIPEKTTQALQKEFVILKREVK